MSEFTVHATKKGELPIKTEKRAKGKKVTVISNVRGKATKLLSALQSLLGVGGTVRRQSGQEWCVEVQGEHPGRVTKALKDFQCLQGLSASALKEIAGRPEVNKNGEFQVARNLGYDKFMKETNQNHGALPDSQHFAQPCDLTESDCYKWHGFWVYCTGHCQPFDMDDVWEENLFGDNERVSDEIQKLDLMDVNCGLRDLGMLNEPGDAIRNFWSDSGITLAEFRKMILPGSKLFGESGERIKEYSYNKIGRKAATSKAWDGSRAKKNYVEMGWQTEKIRRMVAYEKGEEFVAKKKIVCEESDEEWKVLENNHVAVFSIKIDWDVPPCSWPKELVASFQEALTSWGSENRLTVTLNLRAEENEKDSIVVSASEELMLSKDSLGYPPDKNVLKLNKKLKDILALVEREKNGEKMAHNQLQKIAGRGDALLEIVMDRWKGCEKSLLKLLKFHEKNAVELFEGEVIAADGDKDLTFSSIHKDSAVTLSSGGKHAASRLLGWAGCRVNLTCDAGQCAEFAIESERGILRVGWGLDGCAFDLGTDEISIGIGGTGKKAHGGEFTESGVPEFKNGDVVLCRCERSGNENTISASVKDGELHEVFFVDFDGVLHAGVCGNGRFKAKLLSGGLVEFEDDPNDNYEFFDPPRRYLVVTDSSELDNGMIEIFAGEVVWVTASDESSGSFYGYFISEEDDGGWFPANSVQPWDDENAAEINDTIAVPGEMVEEDDWAAPPPPPPPILSTDSDCKIFVAQWFLECKLPEKYVEPTVTFCTDRNISDLDALKSLHLELGEHLGLKPLERKRLAKSL
eukprot:gene774-525_t